MIMKIKKFRLKITAERKGISVTVTGIKEGLHIKVIIE